jgi:hypothetical protein
VKSDSGKPLCSCLIGAKVGGCMLVESTRAGVEICDLCLQWAFCSRHADRDANCSGIADGAVGFGDLLDMGDRLRRYLCHPEGQLRIRVSESQQITRSHIELSHTHRLRKSPRDMFELTGITIAPR